MKNDIQQKVMTSDLSFLDFFMRTLIEDARWTPKLQLERVIGPLLTPFIARLMTRALQNVDGLRGEYDLICAEFPLLKETDPNTQKKNYQSTNIDWLLLNNTNNKLVLLELKTNHQPPRVEQAEIYSQYIGNNSETISKKLWEDYTAICSKSDSKVKYIHQCGKIRRFLQPTRNGSQVVYLLPEKMTEGLPEAKRKRPHRRKDTPPPDHTLCFRNLNFEITGNHSSAWNIIRKHLIRLDERTHPAALPCTDCV